MKIKIFAHEFEVIFESPELWAQDGMGRSSIKEQKIYINSEMDGDAKFSTLLHEIIYAIADLNSLQFQENEIDALALGLFTTLKDSPELAKHISLFHENGETPENRSKSVSNGGHSQAKGLGEIVSHATREAEKTKDLKNS